MTTTVCSQKRQVCCLRLPVMGRPMNGQWWGRGGTQVEVSTSSGMYI